MTATAARQRQQQAYEMRQTGASYHQIALALGWVTNGVVYPGSARKAVLAEAKRRAFDVGTTRRFGVEIEFIGINRQTAAAAIRAAGIECYDENYNHHTRPHWKVVPDGSLSSRSGSGECVSPILSGEEGFAQLRTVVNALRAAGARISVSCGLHVHHDANDLTGDQIARVVEFYDTHRNSINALVSRSRRHSQWARAYGASELASITASLRAGNGRSLNVNRYKNVNLMSYVKYGTLEFRQHQGTLNADKIVSWIKFGQAIFAAVVNDSDTTIGVTLDEMLNGLAEKAGLDTSSAAYLKSRADRLAA